MGLFGALFAGVSGLDSQSNKIGIISNNISNVNTIGFKQGQSTFDTLVVPSGTTSFSPGGVIGGNQQLVNQQGTIAATTSPTDVAVSGNGFFVVSQSATGVDAGGTPLYTRAGSFTQDADGNFVNANGYYLQGLPILSNGQPKQANTQNLQTVQVSQSATGSPTATTTVAIQANLNAQQTVFPGASATATMSPGFGTTAVNANPAATQIILGNDYGETPVSGLVRGDQLNITSTSPATGPVHTSTYTYGGYAVGRSVTIAGAAGNGDLGAANPAGFTGNILNATSVTSDFITSGTSAATNLVNDFTAPALHFTITVAGGTPVTLTYSGAPNPSAGTFNNLTTLAQAISDSPGLTATVGNNNRLYVSALNPNDAITFANGDATGSGGALGIDWISALDLKAPTLAVGDTYFNSLQSLANDISAPLASGGDPNLTATVNNPNAASTLTITEANPEQEITFQDAQAGGSILEELGFRNRTGAAAPFTVGPLGVTYDPTKSATDMSSGLVTPQFTKDITVFDAQGFSHTLALNFLKIGTDTWAMEVTAVPASDVQANPTTDDAQLASGTIQFLGNGSLGPVTGSIAQQIPITWKNGADPSLIALDLGELPAALTDGAAVTQTAGASTVSQVTQNGAPTGELTGVTIDQNGFVIASFSNGQTQKLYQVPLAVLNNPDGMLAVSGDAYQQTLASGQPALNFANQGGAGQFTPSALEQSNVDLSTQLTNLIVAQQAYGANSKVLTVTDSLLQELDQVIQ